MTGLSHSVDDCITVQRFIFDYDKLFIFNCITKLLYGKQKYLCLKLRFHLHPLRDQIKGLSKPSSRAEFKPQPAPGWGDGASCKKSRCLKLCVRTDPSTRAVYRMRPYALCTQ